MGHMTLTTQVCNHEANTWHSLPVCQIWRL